MAARRGLPPELWEQQHGETAKQYEAFAVYRDLGPKRTARKVAEVLHKSWDLMHRWQRKNAWMRRAEAYDRATERERLLDATSDLRDMHLRHAKVGSAFLNAAVTRLQTLDPKTLTTRDLIRWVDVACKVERTARGEYAGPPPSRPPAGPAVAERPLTDEERQVRLEQLHAELSERLDIAPGPASAGATARAELAGALEVDE